MYNRLMMNEYPFDGGMLLKKAKKTIRELRADGTARIPKKIAVLGGSTTFEIVRMMEIFLLRDGIDPSFYESEYAQYYEDAVFGNPELDAFKPDLVYVYTTFRNLKELPSPAMGDEEAAALSEQTKARFQAVWDGIRDRYHCPVIQNNFEFPPYRIMGNYEAVSRKGVVRFVNDLNRHFAECAEKQPGLYLHDLQYLCARYGLDAWQDEARWNLYKYALSMEAVPELAYSVTRIVKSLFGRNKKVLALDLDNTLWGGVIGDDGQDGIEIGEETAAGETFKAFQTYVKKHKDIGVLLAVDSKNEPENALLGLNHPQGVLRPDDFVAVKANWDPKSKNLTDMAEELSLLPESFVFVDDNPAEREIIRGMVPQAAVPEVGAPESYIRILDHAGYFEVTTLSADDMSRNEMYRENAKRKAAQASFKDYGDYLRSLEMKAHILPFEEIYYPRITQLTNKSNQFNLTTKRYTEEEIAQAAKDPDTVTLYGQLADRFGDNGIVSVVIGSKAMQLTEEERDAQGNVIRPGRPTGEPALLIDLWLMSCRVLKRDMEFAMMDALVRQCEKNGIRTIFGYYYPTAKNGMVREFYAGMGFTKIAEDEKGNTVWKYAIEEPYAAKNRYITVEES